MTRALDLICSGGRGRPPVEEEHKVEERSSHESSLMKARSEVWVGSVPCQRQVPQWIFTKLHGDDKHNVTNFE